MKTNTMITLMIISIFILGIPLNIIAFIGATNRLSTEKNIQERNRLRTIQTLSGIITVIMIIIIFL